MLDDDEALLGIDDQVVEEGDEGESFASFTVDLTNASDREIEVMYEAREGGAIPAAEGEVSCPQGCPHLASRELGRSEAVTRRDWVLAR